MEKRLPLLLFFLLITCTIKVHAQCDSPSSDFTVTSTDANCLGSGTVTASGVSGGNGVSYQYSLENPTDPGHAKPWQTSANFTEVFSGSYNVLVRSVCAGLEVYSTAVSKPITVGGNYQALYLTASAVPPVSRCIRGIITATATNGYIGQSGSYQYALVTSLTVPEPSAATRQSSNLFPDKEPGTYYVRVYDDCGDNSSYATTEVTVGANALDTYFNPFVVNTYIDCNQINVYANLNDASSGFGAPGSTLTLTFPTGATLSTAFPAYPGTVANFGVQQVGDLYDLTGSWPQNVLVSYDDGCPLPPIEKTVVKPQPNLILTPVTVGCDTDPGIGVSVVFTQTQSPNLSCWDGFYEGCYGVVKDAQVSHVTYSLNGAPWVAWDGQPIPIGLNPDLKAKWCDGAEIPVQYSAPSNDLTDAACEINGYSCIGRTGFLYNQLLNGNPIGGTIHFTSVPAGQAPISDVAFTSQSSDFAYTAGLQNLLPGLYEYEVTVSTGCGSETLEKSILLSHPYGASLTASLPPTCNSNATVQIVMTEDNFKCETKNGNFGSRYVQEFVGGTWGSLIFVGEPNVTGLTFSLHNVAPGVHRYRVVRGTDCEAPEVTITVGGGTSLTLLQDLATNLCPGVGVVKMTASGGTSHTFSLYQGAVSPANLIAGPQSGNSFSGLDPNLSYTIQTTNNCGTSVQSLVSFSNAPVPIFIEGATPCVDSSITLKVYTFPDVDYQWYFDDGTGAVAIPGETGPTLTLPSLTAADKGSYYATITYESCTANSPTINLDPENCAIPGSVRGTIYLDANAGIIDGTPTNVDGQLWVDLVDATETVLQSVPVQENGTFFFPGVSAGTYKVVQRIVSSTAGIPRLPAGFVRTADGENNPPSTGDGTADGIITFTLASGGEKTHLDFGINLSQLPVKLLSFKVVKEGVVALLSWSTTAEENSKLFEVERSSDAKKWTKIASIPAQNSSSVHTPYAASDLKPLNGVNYYRLKMVDNDLSFGYSPMRSIEFGGKPSIVLYPNPVKDKLQIESPNWQNVSKVVIFNLNGNAVYNSGSIPQSVINVQSLASGMYIVKITYSNGTTENLKVAIAR